MHIDFSTAIWVNQSANYEVSREFVRLQTEPNTDFWQRTYYGFRNENAPALLVESDLNFTFTMRATFSYTPGMTNAE